MRIDSTLEPLGVKFVATVHDEVVFECTEEQADYVKSVVKEEMEKAGSQFITDLPCIFILCITPHTLNFETTYLINFMITLK